MQERRADSVVRIVAPGVALGASRADHEPLKSLAGESVADRYCAWRGASAQRYVASIFPVDPAAADGGLPEFEGFVLIAVARREVARRILLARAVERASDARTAVARGLAEGADEWHVHFLAETPSARAGVVVDLCRRHLAAGSGPTLAPVLAPMPASRASSPLLRLAS